ncbi:hypothetical protein TNCV_4074551 [Trichonephila clavipes]|uniref:Uncharacterized protein n=1 Tax=Trichonephila clavipes TaxID=2585209 RepID=A0A8X6W876_TRICX|nr:hypothetical protein TNCV_4074551 [Trichonephila clavipes]
MAHVAHSTIIHHACLMGNARNDTQEKIGFDTLTGNDGYPLYRRRSVEDGGKSVVLTHRNIDIEVEGR